MSESYEQVKRMTKTEIRHRAESDYEIGLERAEAMARKKFRGVAVTDIDTITLEVERVFRLVKEALASVGEARELARNYEHSYKLQKVNTIAFLEEKELAEARLAEMAAHRDAWRDHAIHLEPTATFDWESPSGHLPWEEE